MIETRIRNELGKIEPTLAEKIAPENEEARRKARRLLEENPRNLDDAKNALKTAIAVVKGEEVPKLNYFDTPKITINNMSEFTKPVF